MYVLFKNPVQLDTLAVVRFLHSLGVPMRPAACIERNHPSWVTQLPAIQTLQGRRYVGLHECVQYWQQLSGQPDLLARSEAFQLAHPEYRVRR